MYGYGVNNKYLHNLTNWISYQKLKENTIIILVLTLTTTCQYPLLNDILVQYTKLNDNIPNMVISESVYKTKLKSNLLYNQIIFEIFLALYFKSFILKTTLFSKL